MSNNRSSVILFMTRTLKKIFLALKDMEEQAAEDIENLKAGKPLGDKRHQIHNKLPGFYLNVTLPKALVYIYT